MKTDQVFGISPQLRSYSYVDRGELDSEITRYLNRDTHIALRGESKCGKSWLRQKNIPNAIVVQCRLSKTTADIFIDALSQLEIKLVISSEREGAFKGSVTAKGEIGVKLLGTVGIDTTAEMAVSDKATSRFVGHDIEDLRFVVNIIKASGRRLVIEDFHYMKMEARRQFAFDMKAMWDYGLFVVIIGVWSQSNMLLHLNPDLSGRMHELSIEWSDRDLGRVMEQGGRALGIKFSAEIVTQITTLSFGNVGILQKLALMTLDAGGVFESSFFTHEFGDSKHLETAALQYAEQLNPLYQQFARNVSGGIRSRKNSTGIYAHAMAVIMAASDNDLMQGLNLDKVFAEAQSRQQRIQKGNLRTVLERLEELQIDADGRGLVLAYNPANGDLAAVDRQILLYRRYCTVKWPWEDLVREAEASDSGDALVA